MKRTLPPFLLLIFLITACSQTAPEKNSAADIAPMADSILVETQAPKTPPPPDYDTTQWTELTRLDTSITLDLRYATTNNFVKKQLYDCPRCFLRPVVAEQLASIHGELRAQGLGLKMFDCYRPRPVQWALWEIVPNPQYVADPRKGSMHNRGGAVDLTIVNAQGEELEMGTDFDFFGREAYHDYTEHPEIVLQNRTLLKSIMEKYNFKSTRTEWWHYSYRPKTYALDDMVWNCTSGTDVE